MVRLKGRMVIPVGGGVNQFQFLMVRLKDGMT